MMEIQTFLLNSRKFNFTLRRRVKVAAASVRNSKNSPRVDNLRNLITFDYDELLNDMEWNGSASLK